MQSMSSSMANVYCSQLEASRHFAEVMFAGTERIDRVLIEATHHAFSEQVDLAQAVAEARNPQDLANAQAAFFSRRPDNAVNYQKEIMSIFAEMQNELGRSMQDYIKRLGNAAASGATASVKAAQERTDGASLNPVNDMLSAWGSAFTQMASLANRNMATARSNFQDAVSTVTSAAEDVLSSSGEAGAEATRRTQGYVSEAASKAMHSANGHGASHHRSSDTHHGKSASHAKKAKPAASRRR